MTLALPLYFDPAAEAAIQTVIAALAEHGVAPFMQSAGIRPHLTLAIYRDIDPARCETLLKPLVGSLPPLPLLFSHLGVFTSPDPVVFLAPTPTRALAELHQRVNALLAEAGDQPSSYYLPDLWVPHCTLAVEFDENRISEAVEIARRLPLPLRGWGAQICLVAFPDFNHLFRLDINHPEKSP